MNHPFLRAVQRAGNWFARFSLAAQIRLPVFTLIARHEFHAQVFVLQTAAELLSRKRVNKSEQAARLLKRIVLH